MTPEIREIDARDLTELHELAARFASSFTVDRATLEITMRELMSDPSAHLSGAVVDGRLVGDCLGFDHRTFFANGRVSWVEEIMVADDARRLGIGRMLMNEFEIWARARGSKMIALGTRRAEDFYEALGYERSATYYRRLL